MTHSRTRSRSVWLLLALVGLMLFGGQFRPTHRALADSSLAPLPSLQGAVAVEFIKQLGLYASHEEAAAAPSNPNQVIVPNYFVQQGSLFNPINRLTSRLFGSKVTLAGDILVVGDSSYSDDSNVSAKGIIHVFVRNGAAWNLQATLKASNPDPDDSFGVSIAVSGNTIVVGAPGESSNATGVNGEQSNNSMPKAGAAYVFVRTGTTWSQQAYLKASNTRAQTFFGSSVTVSEDTVVVGAAGSSPNLSTGAAYVFTRTGTTWSQQALLQATNGHPDDRFGYSAVTLVGNTLVLGAEYHSSKAAAAGAAYVYVRSGATWTQQGFLTAANGVAGDNFGSSVALSGDTVAVGARLADTVYVYVRNGTTWSQQAFFKDTKKQNGDSFSESVALAGNLLVSGNAFFTRNGTTWGEQTYFKTPFPAPSSYMGNSAAMSGNTVVLGDALAEYAYIYVYLPPIIVNSLADGAPANNGQCTLREAIINANGNNQSGSTDCAPGNGADTITFSIGTTINLTSALPDITDSLTINGRLSPTEPLLTVRRDTGGDYRIFNITGGTVSLNGLTIANGKADNGGGVLSNAATLNLNDCYLTGNTATEYGGGFSIDSGTATLTDCTVSENTAGIAGGGGGAFFGAKFTVSGSTFSGNSARNSSALELEGVTATITNSTISGNTTRAAAGAINHIALDGLNSSLTLINCTITGNQNHGVFTGDGGSASNSAVTQLQNTIVAGNTGPNFLKSATRATITSLGNNIDGDGTSGFTNGVGGNLVGTAANKLDARLAALGNNGGRTATHALLVGSPAIDAGRNTGAPATDQRGIPRPAGSAVDIGAVESRTLYVNVAAGADNNSGATTGAALKTIAKAITTANGGDILLLAAGTYPENDLQINRSLSIQGAGAGQTIIDGRQLNRVISIYQSRLTVNLSKLTVTGGKAPSSGDDYDSGGISSNSDLTLTDCAITNNVGRDIGGGVFLYRAGGSFTGCTFSGNSAGLAGGGIAFQTDESHTLRLTNCTVSGNSAAGLGVGGGISYIGNGAGSTLEVVNSTFANNTGAAGGGVYTLIAGTGATATTRLRNTLFANNTPLNLAKGFLSDDNVTSGGSALITSLGNNLASDGGGGFLTGPGDQINKDPKLSPLANHGGATQTHLLLCGSPAINAGSNTGAPANDQRGFARPLGGTADIGAVEGDYSVSIVQIPLPNGQVGKNYDAGIYTTPTTTGLPLTFTAVTPLPAGLRLERNVAGFHIIVGTPTVAVNSFGFILMAVDDTGKQGCFSYSITIAPSCNTINIGPATLPNGRPDQTYTQPLTQTGGTGAITWSLAAGSLPRSVTLNATTGVISGMPTQTGPFNFTIRATDANGCTNTRDYTINVVCQTIVFASAPPLNGTVNAPYVHNFTSIGALGAERFSRESGTLPPGLTLGPDGRLAGTPTQSGSFTAGVKTTDQNGCMSGVQTFTIVINPAACQTITINPAALASASLNANYTQTFTASGGTGTYRFRVSAGTLPTGLMLADNGMLTGRPTTAGLTIFTVTVTDGSNCPGERSFTLNVYQQTPAAAADGTANDQFGTAVAISGETAVIGAPGVNASRGLVYVYNRVNGNWVERQRLSANNGAAGDQFGSAISFNGSYILIGAKGTDVTSKTDQGSAYLFSFENNGWAQRQQLFASDGAVNDRFGSAVAISFPRIVIGAPGRNGNRGAAYLFRQQDASMWEQFFVLTASNGAAGDQFGASVGFNGLIVVVGSPRDGTVPAFAETVEVAEAASPEQILRPGTAYLFTRGATDTSWTQQQLTPNDGAAGDQFGKAIASSGNRIIIGAPGKNAAKGGAYIFGTDGGQQANLDTGISVAGSRFGAAVSISGDIALVGAPGDNPVISLVPDETNQTALQGFAALFMNKGTAWPLQQLIPSGSASGQNTQFGGAVAVDGNNVVIGAPNDSSKGKAKQGAASLLDPCPTVTLVFTPASLAAGMLNTAYNQPLTVTGGAAPYGFTVLEGQLPTGLTLAPNGTLTGSPTQSGSFIFTVRVADATNCLASRPYQLTINAAPSLVTSVSAASYLGIDLASESIVAAFGVKMATGIGIAETNPLPLTLLGTTVKVKDSAGVERSAPLFFVSPSQINYLMPAGTALGAAIVTVTSGEGALSTGSVLIGGISPGLFTANATGIGVPAALLFRLKANGEQLYETITQIEGGILVPAPIDLGPSSDQVFLILFGTGIRGRSNDSQVRALIGGVEVSVPYAGAQGGLVGLDQLNVGALPRNLAGRGRVDLVISINGKATNTVQVSFK